MWWIPARSSARAPTTPLRGAPDGRPLFRSADSGSTPPLPRRREAAPRRLRRPPDPAGRKDASLRAAVSFRSVGAQRGALDCDRAAARSHTARPPRCPLRGHLGPRRTRLQRDRVAFAGGGGQPLRGDLFSACSPPRAASRHRPSASPGPLARKPKNRPCTGRYFGPGVARAYAPIGLSEVRTGERSATSFGAERDTVSSAGSCPGSQLERPMQGA